MFGGAALAYVGVRRYEKEEFYKLVETLVPKISKILETDVSLTRSYGSKESFGDMDLLILSKPGNPQISNIKEVIEKHFSPKGIHHNGNCWSFDHKDLQIDLILTPEENWETSKVFFAYNDLGNLMGKLYHKFGLKYGYDGVKYVFRREDEKKLGAITITKDMRKAFEFLGLDWDKFETGFEDIEDIFDYVIGSKYFDHEAFQMENLNAINKSRNKRRKVYNQFLEYLLDGNITKTNDWSKDKSIYWEKIDKYFPEAEFKSNMDVLIAKDKAKTELTEKFNGKLIMKKFPYLTGPLLGEAIKNFKEQFEEFDLYLTENDADKIMEDFQKSL